MVCLTALRFRPSMASRCKSSELSSCPCSALGSRLRWVCLKAKGSRQRNKRGDEKEEGKRRKETIFNTKLWKRAYHKVFFREENLLIFAVFIKKSEVTN